MFRSSGSWLAALAWRHAPALHARFMLCKALPLFDPDLLWFTWAQSPAWRPFAE